jgi:DNA-binding response OmpR family regulator
LDRISVLIVDGNVDFTEMLHESIRKDENWEVCLAPNGEVALTYLKQHTPNIVVLDIRLPDMSGIHLLEHIISRYSASGIRVIMISGYGNEDERVKCLEMGAADYLAKPFRLGELIHHIKLVLGLYIPQNTALSQEVFTNRDLKVDFNANILIVRGRQVKLTKTEWALLRELIYSAGRTVAYRQLLCKVWDIEYEDEKGILQENIYRLRAKIEPESANPQYTVNIPGIGYRFQMN